VSAELQLNALGPGGGQVIIGRSLDGTLVYEIGIAQGIPSLTFGFTQLLEYGSFANLEDAGLSWLRFGADTTDSQVDANTKVQHFVNSIDGATVGVLREKMEALT
jgi:hypothetical protein